MNDISSQGWSGQDMTSSLSGQDRPHKTEPHFALDLYQVASLFDGAGIARNRRSLSRYCTKGKLDCEKVETLNGEEWRVDEQSVHRLIAQTKEQQRLTHQDVSARPTAALFEDRPTHDQTGHQSEMSVNAGASLSGHAQTMPDSTGNVPQAMGQQPVHDMTGQGETTDGLSTPDQRTEDTPVNDAGEEGQQVAKMDAPLIIQMERENDLLRDQLEKKDNQIENKDKQIDDLIERGREDKMLIQNFQRKLGMLSAPEEDRPVQANPGQNYQHSDQTRLPWQGRQQEGSPDHPVDNSGGRS